MDVSDYKIIKTLGHGIYGTTFLALKNNTKYALKIERIKEKDVKKSLSSPSWREIEFTKKMSKKYPEHFMTLYDHTIIDNCTHKQKYPINIKKLPKEFKDEITTLSNSPYCSIKIWSLVDYTLQQKLKKLTLKQLYSAIIQITYICYLMNKHGYSHNDLHQGNIGIKKTKKKYIKILSKKVPTYGYIYVAIDYGSILHEKYKLSRQEKKKINDKYLWHYQLHIIYYLFIHNEIWDYVIKKKIQISPYDDDLKLMKKHEIYKILKTFSNNVHVQFKLCEILFPHIWQTIILKKNNPQKIFNIRYKIPKADIVYILFNIDNYKNIIHYFNQKF